MLNYVGCDKTAQYLGMTVRCQNNASTVSDTMLKAMSYYRSWFNPASFSIALAHLVLEVSTTTVSSMLYSHIVLSA